MSLEALVSPDHLRAPFTGFARTARSILVLLELLIIAGPSGCGRFCLYLFLAPLAKEGFRAMIFLELVMSLSSSATEVMIVKEKVRWSPWMRSKFEVALAKPQLAYAVQQP